MSQAQLIWRDVRAGICVALMMVGAVRVGDRLGEALGDLTMTQASAAADFATFDLVYNCGVVTADGQSWCYQP